MENYYITGTEVFVQQLWSLSDSPEYLDFVCKGYKIGSLENFVQSVGVGLENAKRVFTEKISTLCSDAGVDG